MTWLLEHYPLLLTTLAVGAYIGYALRVLLKGK